MGRKSNVYRLVVGKPEGQRPLGRARRWISEGQDVVVWAGLVWHRIGTSGEFLWTL
jgi:hypothetical protein